VFNYGEWVGSAEFLIEILKFLALLIESLVIMTFFRTYMSKTTAYFGKSHKNFTFGNGCEKNLLWLSWKKEFDQKLSKKSSH
jgi:hypothetical protein